MITVLSLWQRVNDYAAKYQSGAVVVSTFNDALAEVQLEVYSDLSPYYRDNEKVRGLLNVWVLKSNVSIVNGTYTFPSTTGSPEFDRIVSMAVTDTSSPPTILYEVDPTTEGEIVYASRLPQRKPDITKKRVYYLMDGALVVNTFPKPTSLPVLIYYLIFPSLAKIAFTYTTVSDEDVMTYDSANSVDLAWTKDAFNILLYKMLEKYGITTRDLWIEEYAKLGISKPILNTGGNS